MLYGDDPVLSTLRRQFEVAQVVDRNFTGVGFFTHFTVPAGVAQTEPQNYVIGDVFLEVENTEADAMAMLFIKDGYIDFLEVATYIGDWPDSPKALRILYTVRKSPGDFSTLIAHEERDLAVTRKAWIR